MMFIQINVLYVQLESILCLEYCIKNFLNIVKAIQLKSCDMSSSCIFVACFTHVSLTPKNDFLLDGD